MSQIPGPLKFDRPSEQLPPRTPGPLGHNDAGDPDAGAALGDTPGSLGINDHAAALVSGESHARHGHLVRRRSASTLARRSIPAHPNMLGGRAGIPNQPPPTIAAAPRNISLPVELADELRNLWQSTVDMLPRHGEREFSAVLVKDAHNHIRLRNGRMGGGTYSPPDRTLPETGFVIIGAAHTHPKTTDVGFSGGDIAYIIRNQDLVSLLICGEEQFMLLRTGQSTNHPLHEDKMQEENLKMIDALKLQGRSRAGAVRQSSHAMAAKFGLAYYEGKNGLLTRIDLVKPHTKRRRS